MKINTEKDFRNVTVLVTGASGPTGQGILQSLQSIKNRPKIIATDISPIAAGFYWSDKSYTLPHSSQKENYLSAIMRICHKEKVKIVFPGSDGEARVLTNNSSRFKDVILATSNKSIWEITGDKLFVSNLCMSLNIPTPLTYTASLSNLNKLVLKTGFPVILKQRMGSGSRGISILTNQKKAVEVIKNCSPRRHIIQEYLSIEDNEHTIGVYFYSKKALLIAYKRSLFHGNTISAVTIDSKPFSKTINKIGRYLKMRGYINFQFITKNKIAYLTDINSRFSSSTSMALQLNLNWIEIYLNDIIYNKRIKYNNYKFGITIVRYMADIVLLKS